MVVRWPEKDAEFVVNESAILNSNRVVEVKTEAGQRRSASDEDHIAAAIVVVPADWMPNNAIISETIYGGPGFRTQQQTAPAMCRQSHRHASARGCYALPSEYHRRPWAWYANRHQRFRGEERE
jgi:hypothetical protein